MIASVSFGPLIRWFEKDNWDQIAKTIQSELEAVAAAGADFAVIATNTVHKILPQLSPPLPVISIIDAVAEHAKTEGLLTLGLTGTAYTMSDGFYAEGLRANGVDVVLPEQSDQEAINRMVFDELISGKVVEASIDRFLAITQKLRNSGADGIALSCTELELLTRCRQADVPLLDSATIHADAAWERATRGSNT